MIFDDKSNIFGGKFFEQAVGEGKTAPQQFRILNPSSPLVL